jgi:hypothetical protein
LVKEREEAVLARKNREHLKNERCIIMGESSLDIVMEREYDIA